MAMKLESLKNELLFNIFDYMSFGQILYSFQYLNSHFNQLIFAYLRTTRHLDLRFMSLRDSNIFCQSQLSKIANHIVCLTVSNSDETPLQIEFFHCDSLRFRQFINLQSLSLYHIHSRQIMMEIALEWDYLPHLTHIKLVDCCFPSNNDVNQRLIDKIWNMPKLIRFDIGTGSCGKLHQFWPSVISSSLKYVSIQNSTKIVCLLSKMLQYTPHLRSLHIDSCFGGGYATLPILPVLVKLGFNEGCSLIPSEANRAYQLEMFLRKVPNLCHLTIESSTMFMDGYRWEEIITNYLPKLKIFRYKTAIHFDNLDLTKKRAHALIRSFRSHFWIKNHQWFIRCYLKSENQREHYIIYHTLPDIFTPPIFFTDYVWSVSTSSDENDYYSLMQVLNQATFPRRSMSFCERISNIFRLNWGGIKYLTKTPLAPPFDIACKISHFTNTGDISVELPFEPQFSKFIPKLDQLVSLKVSFRTKDNDQSDLQRLLDQASNLYSLNIVCYRMLTSKFFLADIRNQSIRRLGLPDADSFRSSIFYNLQQCVALSRSPLGKQCEILSIGVQNKECIIYLINEMINLRLLTVTTLDNYIPNSSSPGECYDLITWLMLNLSSTIKIAKYDCCTKHIHFWIR